MSNKSTISSNQRFLTITGIIAARWPGNTFSISSTGTSPRYAKLPIQTGLNDGEDSSPCFSRKHLRTTDLIPSTPIKRSQIAEEPSWNVRWTSSRISSYETRRRDKCKRPDNPLANPCCKSALWNLIAPPLSAREQTEQQETLASDLLSSSPWYDNHYADHFCEREMPSLSLFSYGQLQAVDMARTRGVIRRTSKKFE